jgi:hydrogenase maturation protein HypF
MTSAIGASIARKRILVQGIVQGVGFRPFVYSQALQRGLVGFVLNDSNGVTIEIEGAPVALTAFQQALADEAPPLAHINMITVEDIPPRHENAFVIAHSEAQTERRTLISPDTATCADCLREIITPTDRRYRYPFTNCTNCGPRFTIIQDVPYDRDKTTMRSFPMCPTCQAEYSDPLNRRFHAQPNACPICGPQMTLQNWSSLATDQKKLQGQPGLAVEDGDPITQTAQQLAAGAILAIKGLGGYHLACDALNEEAVRRLRQRKRREARPFALMVPDIATARQLCEINEMEAQLLQSRRRPIVLLPALTDNQIAPGVAQAYTTLGLMLPYTPLHHLLLHEFAAHCKPGRPPALVMTSGNVSDEPIAYQDTDAHQRLSAIADGTLTHNRAIHMRCDDSVMRIVAGGEQLFRRSRGYAPEPLSLSFALPMPLLACGPHLKNTFCLGKGQQAFLGHHIGDLENLETLLSFREGIEHFQRLFDIYPEAIAYDLHPEYLATRYAIESAIPKKIAVQHHHAHIASVIAEHGLRGPVIGVAADGTGYGTDGAIWGCEIMLADLLNFERLAHLTYMPLPGGEQAVHEPWRLAAAYLAGTYGESFLDLNIPFVHNLDRAKWHVLSQMIARNINCPQTSSLGRLFDAVAALIGLRSTVLYEGQAAIELELCAAIHEGRGRGLSRPVCAASDHADTLVYPFAIHKNMEHGSSPTTFAVFPMIRAIVNDIEQHIPIAQIARRFHRSITELFLQLCLRAHETTGLNVIALSGGVFQNRLLLEDLVAKLEACDFQVYLNRRVPPNDGGISLGQLAIAATRLQQKT